MVNWPIVERGGPGTRQDPYQCLYCQSRTGDPHGPECVVVSKRVRVRYSFDLEIKVPHHWTSYQIEFHRNDSSWCADNAIRELTDQANGPRCLCHGFSCEFLTTVSDEPFAED